MVRIGIMSAKTEIKAPKGRPDGKKTDNTVHVRLPIEHIEGIDRIAKENGISRASVVSIAVSRLLKTGL
jgi:hypothetical protein